MIPKIIHYCWFGKNPKPPLILRCIDSWKKICPDYEIIEWNESNFDITVSPYMRQAYEAKKWAFVSDVARLMIVYNHGGIYLDTDVELIKPLDPLLSNEMYMGFDEKMINTGLGFGAVKGFSLLKKMIEIYNGVNFLNPDGSYNMTTCPFYSDIAVRQEGFKLDNTKQTISNITVYPTEYFTPKNSISGKIKKTKNTYSIHHYGLSWNNAERIKAINDRWKYVRIFGFKLGNFVFQAVGFFKHNGLRGAIKKIIKKLKKIKTAFPKYL